MRVFHQNESCLACPHPPSSYEGGREQAGSYHFDEKLSFLQDTTEVLSIVKRQFISQCVPNKFSTYGVFTKSSCCIVDTCKVEVNFEVNAAAGSL